jgi:hypothetical protein
LGLNPRVDFFPIKSPLVADLGNRHLSLLSELVDQVGTEFKVFGNFLDCKPLIGHADAI